MLKKKLSVKEVEPGIIRCRVDSDTTFFVVMDGAVDAVPANGGLRLLPYKTEDQALADGRVLARRMTVKHSLYNTGFAGVKIVARGNPADHDAKRRLLDALAMVLNDLDGAVYTGCDLNTYENDMDYLAEQTPYVLASLGVPVDSSRATALGTYGGLLGVRGQRGGHAELLVHGVGKVGRGIVDQMLKDGHNPFVFDANPAKTVITGTRDVSSRPDWWKVPVDVVVLASGSYVIDPTIASEIQCKAIVSAANAPFTDASVEKILDERGIAWIPDAITNAGAVICDSVEHYQLALFRNSDPEAIYSFVEDISARKTQSYVSALKKNPGTPWYNVMSQLQESGPVFCGVEFPAWLRRKLMRSAG